MDTKVHSLRQMLRSRTRSAHDRVDERYGSLNLQKRADYITFLEAHFLALKGIEDRLALHGSLSAPLPPALTPLICSDLKQLNVTPRLGKAVHCPEANPVGLIYVIAGAHLGAKVLRQAWQKSLDSSVLKAGSYLQSDLMASYWSVFWAEFDTKALSEGETEHVIAGAETAFTVFEEAYEMAQRETTDHDAS